MFRRRLYHPSGQAGRWGSGGRLQNPDQQGNGRGAWRAGGLREAAAGDGGGSNPGVARAAANTMLYIAGEDGRGREIRDPECDPWAVLAVRASTERGWTGVCAELCGSQFG